MGRSHIAILILLDTKMLDQTAMADLVTTVLIVMEVLVQLLSTNVRKHLKPNAIQLHVLSQQSIAKIEKRKYARSSQKEYQFLKKSKFVMMRRKKFVNWNKGANQSK